MNEFKPRKPLMAALMSLILPGFGQLYNGDVNRGLLIFIGFTLCTIPLVVLIALFLPSSIMLPLLILATLAGIGLWIYGVGNAWQAAKKLGKYTLQSWQMPGAYLLIFLTAMLFILPSMTQYVRNNLVASYNIPSGSMEPSVLRGDVLFANRLYNCPQCYPVKPGDVAIFVYPNNRTQHYIKRIIALPSDKIEIGQQQVFVNGLPLSRGKTEPLDDDKVLVTEKLGEHEYQVQWQASDNDDMIELTVPSGEVFVLGDNRSASNDSRKFGTVPLQDVVGKASQIWFSKGEDGVRWDRLGELIE